MTKKDAAKIKIKLDEEPYVDGTFYRLPREDGGESIYVLEGYWYQATGTDEDDNEYTVFGTSSPDGTDRMQATLVTGSTRQTL